MTISKKHNHVTLKSQLKKHCCQSIGWLGNKYYELILDTSDLRQTHIIFSFISQSNLSTSRLITLHRTRARTRVRTRNTMFNGIIKKKYAKTDALKPQLIIYNYQKSNLSIQPTAVVKEKKEKHFLVWSKQFKFIEQNYLVRISVAKTKTPTRLWFGSK